jgi:hypothetical protein
MLVMFCVACLFTHPTLAHAAGSIRPDATVTAVGKGAARAREVLNWALTIQDAGFSSAGAILDVWVKIRDITTFIVVGIIFAIAFGLILHTSWAETQRRSLVTVLIAIIASYLSFTVFVLAIQGVDTLQGKLYNLQTTSGSRRLQADDLLTVGFTYQDFKGYRDTDSNLDEAVNSNLTLVKLTGWTDYAISAVIVIRIVILWLLVIFSPLVFPLIAFSATRNIAVFWLREFGRWLLLGPIFAIFLTAVPYIWQHTSLQPTFLPTSVSSATSTVKRQSGIPLQNVSSTDKPKNVYQSGTNILLTPPGGIDAKLQTSDTFGAGNNLSETDTYMRYIIALIMLWAAVIIPFLLLHGIVVVVTNATNAASGYQLKNYIKNLTGRFGANAAQPKIESKLDATNQLARSQSSQPVYISGDSRNNGLKQERSEADLARSIPIQSLASEAGLINGMGSLNEIVKYQEVSGKSAPLLNLARAESEGVRNPQAADQLMSAIEKMRRAEENPSGTVGKKLAAVKNAIFIKQVEGSKAARSINDAISSNTSGLEKHSLKASLSTGSISELSKAFEASKNLPLRQNPEFQPIASQFRSVETILKQPIKNLLDKPDQLKAVVDFSDKLTAGKVINNFKSKEEKGEKISDSGKVELSDAYSKFNSPTEQKNWQDFAATARDLKDNSGNKLPLLDAAEKTSKAFQIKGSDLEAEDISHLLYNEEKRKDFDEVKKTWIDTYLNSNIPDPKKYPDRKSWIAGEISDLQSILKDLSSDETRPNAIKRLEKTLPYVLLGGYDLSDLVIYIKAKLTAAKEALQNLVGDNKDNQGPTNLRVESNNGKI